MNKFMKLFALAIIMVMGLQTAAQDDVTLRVLIWQNPPTVEFMEEFNEEFTAETGINVDLSIVNASDIGTVTQTRLSANDVDVIAFLNSFANRVQPYMSGVNPPSWQTVIEAGLLLDLSGESFLENYGPVEDIDATYNDGVYAVPVGRTIYGGIYYNEDLFEEFDVAVPTTWDELVAACETFDAEGIGCMTAGGADGWPIFVGSYGLIGSLFPDQEGYVEGLWTGDIAYNDEENLVMWERLQVYAGEMMERGASGIPGDAAPGRFASGAVAMFPGGSWYASAIETSEPDFEWGFIPFPGSNDPEDNQTWYGKSDMHWAIAGNSPHPEEALMYLEAFSEPENYQAFVNAVGFIPTQPGATLDTQIGEDIAVYDDFRIGFEQYWIAPTGAGQFALPHASFFAPFNEFEDPQVLADRAQSDLQSGLDIADEE